ncbi:hypothetical protein F3Y22_tig00004004pilonHSYRG00069 [Hibiscus syriacus]|uniref:Mis18 domain-containing protein n=1 Tax=Hibiscus syriacus TaxID=106335 RepID=A0A6A3CIB9_HIBSY|nr:hypothetical protein F3Y22_tig00004004pilonHSYRG00069 [Hibiscus syriacus]
MTVMSLHCKLRAMHKGEKGIRSLITQVKEAPLDISSCALKEHNRLFLCRVCKNHVLVASGDDFFSCIRMAAEGGEVVEGNLCHKTVNLRFSGHTTYHHGSLVETVHCNDIDCDLVLGKRYVASGQLLRELPVMFFVWEEQESAIFLKLDICCIEMGSVWLALRRLSLTKSRGKFKPISTPETTAVAEEARELCCSAASLVNSKLFCAIIVFIFAVVGATLGA